MHSFTTERLLIRPLAEQDKELYLSLYTNAKIMRHIGTPFTVEVAEQAFSKTIRAMNKPNPTVMTWAIVSLTTEKTIGIQALNRQSKDSAEIGIMLLRVSNGKLIPEEAMGSLMEYGFNQLNLQSIIAHYAKVNLATKRFVKKLGFIPTTTVQPLTESQCVQYISKKLWNKYFIKKFTGEC